MEISNNNVQAFFENLLESDGAVEEGVAQQTLGGAKSTTPSQGDEAAPGLETAGGEEAVQTMADLLGMAPELLDPADPSVDELTMKFSTDSDDDNSLMAAEGILPGAAAFV